jgi:AMP nucleosidase
MACAPISLARLKHYTGTARSEDFQHFILFTNYHRYVDEFVNWAGEQLGKDGYDRARRRGRAGHHAPTPPRAPLSDTAWRATRCRPIT